jgi:hypothetical protein
MGAVLRLGHDYILAKKFRLAKSLPVAWWPAISATWILTVIFVGTGTLAATLLASSAPLEHLPVFLRPVWAGVGFACRIDRLLPTLRDLSPWKAFTHVATEYLRGLGRGSPEDTPPHAPSNGLQPPSREAEKDYRSTMVEKADFDGRWVSTNPQAPLSLRIKNMEVVMEESRASLDGASVMKQLRLREDQPGHFVARRATDDEVLLFLGVKDSAGRKRMLAAEPPPSILELWWSKGKLQGMWVRVLVRKAPKSKSGLVLYKAPRVEIRFVPRDA